MTMKIDLGKWRSMLGYGPFAPSRTRRFVQFSGGKTSGMMAALSDEEDVICFENTGKEHERTLEFVRNVGEALDREIVWLEFDYPDWLGSAPKFFKWKRVSFETASRDGTPFAAFMCAINEYRRLCGNPKIAPWANGRICTTHLKHRVLDHYLRDIGVEEHDRWIGLRADEPHRVRKLRNQETRTKTLSVPLYNAGITKEDVEAFWTRQEFALDLPAYLGNCTGCFLKDQADIARALGLDFKDVEWWASMQELYPRFGGEDHYGYKKLAIERDIRLEIEDHFAGNRDLPARPSFMDERRFRLVVIQEKKRYAHGPTTFSCACESAEETE